MLLDTSGLLCLLHRAEHHHESALAAYRSARQRLTTDHVLSELVALATVRRLPRAIVLAFVADLLDNPEIETVWVGLLWSFSRRVETRPIRCVMRPASSSCASGK